MKLLLVTLFAAGMMSGARAATVLTNLSGTVSISSLVKGTGGFIATAIEYGFEFTVAGGDHELTTITLGIGTHLGSLPLLVELYGSASGPDTATWITDLTGPSQPVNQQAVYAPVSPVTLTDGSTYFVRLWINGAASNYAIQETTDFATGTFVMGNNYLRNAGSSWGPGDHANEPVMAINANPVPEPAAAALGCIGFLLILRRRRW